MKIKAYNVLREVLQDWQIWRGSSFDFPGKVGENDPQVEFNFLLEHSKDVEKKQSELIDISTVLTNRYETKINSYTKAAKVIYLLSAISGIVLLILTIVFKVHHPSIIISAIFTILLTIWTFCGYRYFKSEKLKELQEVVDASGLWTLYYDYIRLRLEFLKKYVDIKKHDS